MRTRPARRAFLTRLLAGKGPDRAAEYLKHPAKEVDEPAGDEGRLAPGLLSCGQGRDGFCQAAFLLRDLPNQFDIVYRFLLEPSMT